MARRTVVIGDSLGVGTVPYLQRVLGGKVAADVRVGRSSSDGVNQLGRLLRGGADQIIMDLGTNDASPAQLQQSVQRARRLSGGRPIFIPTVNGPGAAQKNALLRNLAGGNVHLVNWANQSHGLTGADGIHASGAGYQKRAQIVAHSIASAPAGSVQSGGQRGGTMIWGQRQFGKGYSDEDMPAILAAAQQQTTGHPQPAGSLADAQDLVGPRGGAAYLLGQGLRAPTGRQGFGPAGRTNSPFKRFAVNRGGKLLEAHDYGDGDVKYFARKNPAILQAAVQQSLGRDQEGAPAAPNLSAQDEELLKLLLGNNTLRR